MHIKRISLCAFCDVQRGYYTRFNVHVLQLFNEKHIHNGLYAIKQTIPHAYMLQDPHISPVEVLYFIMYRKHYFSKLTNTSLRTRRESLSWINVTLFSDNCLNFCSCSGKQPAVRLTRILIAKRNASPFSRTILR